MYSSSYLAIPFGMLLAFSAALAQEDMLSGTVTDSANQPIPKAVVMICEHATGIPVVQETFLPFTQNMQFQQLVFATTDARGAFVIRGVKSGTYRLIAQSWSDASGPIQQLIGVNGRMVHLHGIAASVTVPSEKARNIALRPLGTATLSITTAPQAPNDETILVVSSDTLAADPILGFASWSGSFMPKMVAANRMPKGKTTFHGFPAGTWQLAAFAADNNPGFGGIRCTTKAGTTTEVSLPLIASWSDGHKQPPKNLETLVEMLQADAGPSLMERLVQRSPQAAKALEQARRTPQAPWSGIIPLLDITVELENGKQVPLKDLLAAEAYAKLQKHEAQRKANAQQSKLKKMKGEPSVTYEQAFQDLYDQLGRNYPCFQLKGINWKAVGNRLLPQVKEVSTDEEFGLLCLEMVAALEDSHAQLLPAAAPIPKVKFPAWDAGFACLVDDRGKPVVYYVADNSAAANAGLQIGMTVTQINEIPVAEGIEQTMQNLKKYVGYSSSRYLRYHAFRFFTRQLEQGETFTLRVADQQGSEKDLVLQANHAAGYIPRLPVARAGIRDAGNVSWKMLDGEIGYIYVRRIKNDLIEQLDRAVANMKTAGGLIIDVRGNSGGGFDAKRAFRNFDLEDGNEPSRPRFTHNIAVLIDARCISAGEGWTSWFVARQRAKLFGETTAGASARKTVYQLRNGLFSVRYPVKAYRGSLDRPIERLGLVPDVPVMPTAEDLANGRDTALEAAKDWLLQQ